jgi:hypothetical protein
MSSCNFNLNFSGTPEAVIRKARAAIEGQGGDFKGDEMSGSFSVSILGNISGSYSITGQTMNVDIDSKPMFIPCSQIESFMKNQFSS